MPATSSMQRLWPVALSLLMAAAASLRAEVGQTWNSYGYEGSILTQQDRLEAIRSALSPLKSVRGTCAAPMTVCALDLEMPSLLVLPNYPDYSLGPGDLMILTSAQAIRLFQFVPRYHTGWITLADVQPPLVTTKYHQVVIRMLQTYGAWKSEADSRLLKSLKGPGDPGFFAVIEWEVGRAGR